MLELTLADVVEGLTGWRPAALNQPIAGVHMDSREVVEGGLFFALRGEELDGHAFLPDALAGGCQAIVAEQAPERGCVVVDTRDAEAFRGQAGRLLTIPSLQETPVCLLVSDSLGALQQLADFWRTRHLVRVIGVTGSVGKTTTKEMIATVLAQRYRVLKSERSINTATGLPLTLLRLTSAHERVVLEMGGGYELGEIARLARIARPQVGIVTNVGPTHLERMGTIERIALNKAELVESLPGDGVAVLNADDPLVRDMAPKAQGRVFFYGLTPEADLWANEIESQGLEGLRFQFHYGDEVIHARVPLLGRHSVHTCLRAAAAGLVEGLSWQEIMDGLRGATQLRLVVVRGVNGSTLLDDTYNSSPASAIAALNLLDELEGRKIAVLGDMLELGSYEEEGHRKVGRRALDVVDLLVTVGPRGRIIGHEALALGMAPEAVEITADNDAAIAYLRRVIAPGDIILIKGSRGMTMEQIVNALSVRGNGANNEARC
jgi:UDP-N-acetylmuramoyl-tripeptide--D-alanyl-D-alanine ligase